MYNEDLAIESFITYCDDMMIAEEGLFSNLKSKVLGILNKLISTIEKVVRKLPNGKFKSKLLELLDKAKRRCTKTKSANENSPDFDKEMKEAMTEASNIQKEFEESMEEIQKHNQKEMEKLEKAKNEFVDSANQRHEFLHEEMKKAYSEIFKDNENINLHKDDIEEKIKSLKRDNKEQQRIDKMMDDISKDLDDLFNDL